MEGQCQDKNCVAEEGEARLARISPKLKIFSNVEKIVRLESEAQDHNYKNGCSQFSDVDCWKHTIAIPDKR